MVTFFICALYGKQIPGFASFTLRTPGSAHWHPVPLDRDPTHLHEGLSDGTELSRLHPKAG